MLKSCGIEEHGEPEDRSAESNVLSRMLKEFESVLG